MENNKTNDNCYQDILTALRGEEILALPGTMSDIWHKLLIVALYAEK